MCVRVLYVVPSGCIVEGWQGLGVLLCFTQSRQAPRGLVSGADVEVPAHLPTCVVDV